MDVKKNDPYLLSEELAHDGKIQRNIIMLALRQLRTSERNYFDKEVLVRTQMPLVEYQARCSRCGQALQEMLRKQPNHQRRIPSVAACECNIFI
jgi:hypothetical protein